MADTAVKVKKAKTPATPRKTTTKKTKAVEAARHTMPSHEKIAELARSYWAARGYHDGSAEQDWLRAEQDLLRAAS